MVSKLILLVLFVFVVILIFNLNNRSMHSKLYTYLALGDSYTIGENVAVYESFPYQTIQLLRKAGHNFNSPEIMARTGWITDDLKQGIRNTIFQNSYDFVSLLIGVNDQYDGEDLKNYATNFELLLKQAISFAANRPDHVFVFSIPDWSLTPFAATKNSSGVANEIEAFNAVNEQLAAKYRVQYISVNENKADLLVDKSLLAPDQLHPSGKEYAKWAVKLAAEIQKLLT